MSDVCCDKPVESTLRYMEIGKYLAFRFLNKKRMGLINTAKPRYKNPVGRQSR